MASGCQDALEAEPSEIDTRSHFSFVEVSKDKRTVSYVGKGSHSDVGAVQANRPCPVHRLLYYFEVEIMEVGTRNCVAVGISGRNFLLNRMPGTEPASFGYRGDEGKKFLCSTRGEPYGPPFARGDVVGCGINWLRDTLFFTRNGTYLGVATTLSQYASEAPPLFYSPEDIIKKDDPKSPEGRWFPTVGLHSPGERVRFRFGPPFSYDITRHRLDIMQEERANINREALAASSIFFDQDGRKKRIHQPVGDRLARSSKIEESWGASGPSASAASLRPALDVTDSLVRSYLTSAGFAETLAAFELDRVEEEQVDESKVSTRLTLDSTNTKTTGSLVVNSVDPHEEKPPAAGSFSQLPREQVSLRDAALRPSLGWRAAV
ncbi:unnamed protein product, partial [Amoebophrya sp. A25]|eukprot:GSA25T00005099001.1